MSGAAEAPIPRPEGHSKCDRTRVRAVGLESPRCIPNRDCTARLSPVLGSGSPRRLRFLCSSICSCVYCWSMPPSPACGSRIGLSAIWRTSRRGRRGGQRTRICRIEIIATDAITSMNPFGRLRSSSDPPHFRRQKVTTPPRGCTTRFQSDVFDPPHFRRQKVTTPPSDPPHQKRDPPLIGGPKTDPPPLTPPEIQKVPFQSICPTSCTIFGCMPNGENFDWNSPNRGVSSRNGPASGHLDGRGGQAGADPLFTASSREWGCCSPGQTGRSRSSSPAFLSSGCGGSLGSSSWSRRSPPWWDPRVSLPRTCSGSAGWRERAARMNRRGFLSLFSAAPAVVILPTVPSEKSTPEPEVMVACNGPTCRGPGSYLHSAVF
jgi:hypothetical protein